jgi:tRNA G18 (ribose-2'-O)-methylase SpoU
MESIHKEQYIILENIRSAHNVGAIFRTADGAGVQKIFLIGYTPTPIDRFGRVQPEISKTSLGASATIPWESFSNIIEVISDLQSRGVQVVAVEQTTQSVSYQTITGQNPTAYIFGNEVTGVSATALSTADAVVDIPMSGQKESLNVATTVGLICFSHRDR